MGNIQGPQKVNDTCVNTMNVETMDRGFTVHKISSLQGFQFSWVPHSLTV